MKLATSFAAFVLLLVTAVPVGVQSGTSAPNGVPRSNRIGMVSAVSKAHSVTFAAAVGEVAKTGSRSVGTVIFDETE